MQECELETLIAVLLGLFQTLWILLMVGCGVEDCIGYLDADILLK